MFYFARSILYFNSVLKEHSYAITRQTQLTPRHHRSVNFITFRRRIAVSCFMLARKLPDSLPPSEYGYDASLNLTSHSRLYQLTLYVQPNTIVFSREQYKFYNSKLGCQDNMNIFYQWHVCSYDQCELWFCGPNRTDISKKNQYSYDIIFQEFTI